MKEEKKKKTVIHFVSETNLELRSQLVSDARRVYFFKIQINHLSL